MEEVAARPSLVADVVGAVRFDDPFRVLENERPAVREWQAARDAAARAALRELPEVAHQRSLQAELERAADAAAPQLGGGRAFRVGGPGREQVWVAERLGGRERRLVAAAQLVGGRRARIDWIAPSPDGRLLAVGVAATGDEQSELRLVDVDSGEVGPLALPGAGGGAVVWLPDATALLCLVSAQGDHRSLRRRLVCVTPGGTVEPLELPACEQLLRPSLQLSGDGRRIALIADPYAPRLAQIVELASGTTVDGPPLAPGETLAGAFAGTRYVAVTTRGAPRGRLVAADCETLSRWSAWEELVPQHPTEVLRAVGVMHDALVLFSTEGSCSRCRVTTLCGRPSHALELPGDGQVAVDPRRPALGGAELPAHVDGDGITFSFSTVRSPPATLRYDHAERRVRRLRTACGRRLDGVGATRGACRADDGWEVPFEWVERDPGRLEESRPTLLVAYGGWNAVSAAAAHPGPLAPLLEAGARIVFVHARGDATFGIDHWAAGRRAVKQRTFDDVRAVAELLVASGAVPEGRLGLWGASNGGLAVGALLTQRPELFGVAVALVPLFDMARFPRERFGEYLLSEYGDPRIADQAAWLRAYSPYHNVTEGMRCPPLLIVCGDADMRIHPWHGRKMAARLRAAAVDPEQIHLRVHEGLGHVDGAQHGPAELFAEAVGFVAHHLALADGAAAEARR